jgi:serine/threonine protein kinase/Tfp pilus assembly protein PilF
MTPERWRQIDLIFQSALEVAPEDRSAFIKKTCNDDESLRSEVEKLLMADEQAGGLIEIPAYAVAAPMIVKGESEPLAGRIGHYQIISLLGKGGMGEVYRAEDTRLRREVAIKILPAGIGQEAGRLRRFEQEARAASALNHPNIITIHEVGVVEGVRYIVTEYVEGETLRQRLTRIPRQMMRLTEAVEFAVQIAAALSAAHKAGITHRDIKPENVMIRPDGLVKVLDFGLAKLTVGSEATPEVHSQSETRAGLSTESGMVMGTVSYMSPEQARGQKVDRRTDIFSLGVMLYEMLAGRRPFAGETMSDEIAALLTAEPPPLRQHRAEAPADLERIVSRCILKDRMARYQSAEELIAELKTLQSGSHSEGAAAAFRSKAARARFSRRRWTVAAALVAMLSIGLVWFFAWRRAPAVQPDQIKSLAVLPLENLSADSAQEYFADGMTEALISNLSQVRALRVISRTSIMRFKESHKPVAEIARELNVDAVIEGSVQRDGGRVKITVRLIRAADESPLRSFDYERELADVLKLQGDVARAVTSEIQMQVTTEEQARMASARRVNPVAHEAYLLGRYHLRRQNDADLKLAISHLERAIGLDASYAPAWAGLSVAWQQRGLWGATPFREVEMPATKAAFKALELDAGSAEGYNSLAVLKNQFDWDWPGSEHDFRRALELDPGNAEAHNNFAILLMALGRHAEAINEIQIAEKLDPVSAVIQSDFGRVLYRARKYGEAEPHFKRALALDPLNDAVHGRLTDLYAEMGRYTDAIANMEKVEARRGGGGIRSIAQRARVYARMGRRGEALQLLKDLQRTTGPAMFPKVSAAAAWAALGEKDEAFKLLFNAVEERSQPLFTIKEDPPFDALRPDRRWKDLLRRMRFPEEQ